MKYLLSAFFILFISANLFCQVKWSVTIDSVMSLSSPRAMDLTGDGVRDVVIGLGNELSGSPHGVIALNGNDGSVLWRVNAGNEIFGSARFIDLTADSVPDVIISGRDRFFAAINGSNGNIIWEFDTLNPALPGNVEWYNFYTVQFVPDQNADGIEDIVQTNGGDRTATTNRPPGHLCLFSGADGELLSIIVAPDSQEIYSSPVVCDLDLSGEYQIIFGTGGEQHPGALWKISLTDLKNGNSSNISMLVNDTLKGFIAPPSLADINGDTVYDIIVPAFNEKLIALDGQTNQVIWQVNLPNTESYSTPAVGYFNNDSVPDFFTSYGIGDFWFYDDWIQFMVDGQTGLIQYQDSGGIFHLTSPLAFDYNGDGFDEALFMVNDTLPGGKIVSSTVMHDFINNNVFTIGSQRIGSTVASTPWCGDVDQDGLMDIVYAYSPDSVNSWSTEPITIECYNAGVPVPAKISWGSYMGTDYNSIFPLVLPDSVPGTVKENETRRSIKCFPNPASGQETINISHFGLDVEAVVITNIYGKTVQAPLRIGKLQTLIDIKGLSPGVYIYQLMDKAGKHYSGRVIIL